MAEWPFLASGGDSRASDSELAGRGLEIGRKCSLVQRFFGVTLPIPPLALKGLYDFRWLPLDKKLRLGVEGRNRYHPPVVPSAFQLKPFSAACSSQSQRQANLCSLHF
jgi:hypothetical protein